MGRRLRVVIVLSVLAGIFAGCGPDATDLSTCENARFKQRLCDVDEFPVAGVCGGTLSDTERCRAECWYDASCEDFALEDEADYAEDHRNCLNECGFTCEDGRDIPGLWRCDGRLDCVSDTGSDGGSVDTSDEADCGG